VRCWGVQAVSVGGVENKRKKEEREARVGPVDWTGLGLNRVGLGGDK